MNTDQQESTGYLAENPVNPSLQPPIYHKLDGFASSIEQSTKLLYLIREAQEFISYVGQRLQVANQTVFEHECTIENLERDVSGLQKQLATRQTSDAESNSKQAYRLRYRSVQASRNIFALCGFSFEEGITPSDSAIRLVEFLDSNRNASWIAFSALPIDPKAITETLRELPRIQPRQLAIGNGIVNPLFDSSRKDLVNELRENNENTFFGKVVSEAAIEHGVNPSVLSWFFESLPFANHEDAHKFQFRKGPDLHFQFSRANKLDDLQRAKESLEAMGFVFLKPSQSKPEPQSDPGDESEPTISLHDAESYVKALCEIIGVSTREGTFTDWISSVLDKFVELRKAQGETGAKEELC